MSVNRNATPGPIGRAIAGHHLRVGAACQGPYLRKERCEPGAQLRLVRLLLEAVGRIGRELDVRCDPARLPYVQRGVDRVPVVLLDRDRDGIGTGLIDERLQRLDPVVPERPIRVTG